MTGPKGLLLSGYGKLPFSREYLRLHFDGNAAFAFREFLDEEAGRLLKGLDGRECNRCDMVFSQPGERIVASVWPSSDAGGMRRFPFSFFTSIRTREIPPPAGGMWTGLNPVFEELGNAYAEARVLPDRAAMEQVFDPEEHGLSSTISPETCHERQQSTASSIPVRDWAEGAFGDVTESFPVALWHLMGVKARLQADAADYAGLKLPLNDSLEIAVQVDAWLQFICDGVQTIRWDPNMVVSSLSGGRGKHLAIFFRPFRIGDLAVLEPGFNLSGFADVTVFQEPSSLSGYMEFNQGIRKQLAAGLTLDRISEIVKGMNS